MRQKRRPIINSDPLRLDKCKNRQSREHSRQNFDTQELFEMIFRNRSDHLHNPHPCDNHLGNVGEVQLNPNPKTTECQIREFRKVCC